jgi:tyrosyl-tRNA synthetase
MSKSEGDVVPLDAQPNDMFGKIMALPDGVIVPLLQNATFLPLADVEEVQQSLEAGANPRDAKMRLAREITTICHGSEAAQQAQQAFQDTFQGGEVPQDVPTIAADVADDLAGLAVAAEVATSKSEFRRLISQGAVENAETGATVDDLSVPETEVTLKVGKHRFLKIVH